MIRSLIIVALMAGFSVSAQDNSFVTGEKRMREWDKHVEMIQNSMFRNLNWIQVGPVMNSGRISSIVGIPGNTSIIYAGTPVGGVWKTENAGTTWFPVFDDQPTQMIGDIEVCPDNPDLVWVGTGSSNLSGSAFPGLGVFKSVDGGKTWVHKGLVEAQNIMRIAISADDPDLVYVAAMGNKYYPEEKTIGLFKTTDGGNTWKKVLSDDRYTGCADVVFDPENSNVLYATTWNRKETVGHVYKTMDGGLNWIKMSGGLPEGKNIGRIGVDVSPVNPEVVYLYLNNHNRFERDRNGSGDNGKRQNGNKEILSLKDVRKMSSRKFLLSDSLQIAGFLRRYGIIRSFNVNDIKQLIENGERTPETLCDCIEKYWMDDTDNSNQGPMIGGEVYKTINGGETWYKTHTDTLYLLSSFGWSFCDIKISPVDENDIYILGVTLQHSSDGGTTFDHMEGNLVHVQPNISKYLHLDQHDIWIDPLNPERILLGNDGGTFISFDKGKNWMHHNTIPIGMFYKIAVDMEEPYNIYGGTQDDSHVYGPSDQNIAYNITDRWKYVWLDRWSGGDGLHIIPDINDPNTVYYSSQSGALRRKNMSENENVFVRPQREFCEPALRHDWSTPFYVSPVEENTIYYGANRLYKSTDRGDTWIALSPDLTKEAVEGKKQNDKLSSTALCDNNPDLIYAGSNEGIINITRDGGKTWTNVSESLPDIRVNTVDISDFDDQTVYIALSPTNADRNPYLFSSNDYGKTWRSINGNLPVEKTRCIIEDPEKKGLLFAGTELGVYVSMDDGEKWHSLNTGLPAVSVDDLLVHPMANELVIGTYGRGIYKMDITPLRAIYDEIISEDLHLFNIKEAKMPERRDYEGDWFFETAEYPEFVYYLKAGGEVKVEIENESSEVVKTFNIMADKGINIITWDLIKSPARYTKSAYKTGTELYPPGSYKVRISKGDKQVEGSFLLAEHDHSDTFDIPLGVCTDIANNELLFDAGYNFIEESVRSFLVPNLGDDVFLKNLAKLDSSKLNIEVCNLFIPGNLKSVGPEADHKAIIEYSRVAFKRAKQAGVKIIVFGSGGSRQIPESFPFKEARAQFISLGKKLGPVAAESDITIVLEPLNSADCNFINSVKEGGEIVKEIDHPNFMLLADIYHMKMDNEDPGNLIEYGNLLRHIHIAEKEGRSPPGTHGEDFSAFFDALRKVNYKGGISIESRWEDMNRQAGIALREMIKQLY